MARPHQSSQDCVQPVVLKPRGSSCAQCTGSALAAECQDKHWVLCLGDPGSGQQEVKVCSVPLLQTDEKLQVILRQQDISLGSPMTPEQLEAYELPLLWQLYPGKRYRGSDSTFWQILYHVKASRVYPRDRVGDLQCSCSQPGAGLG